MSDLEKDLKEFYTKTDYDIQPDMNELARLQAKFEENKKLNVKQNIFWKRFLISACCILIVLIPAIILPIILNNQGSELPTYYAKDTIKDDDYSLQDLNSYTNTNYNQLNFLFDDEYTIKDIVSYTISDGTQMMFTFSIKEAGHSTNISFVTYKNFVFDEHNKYTDYATITNTTKHTKYYKENIFSFEKEFLVLYDYGGYRIYVKSNELNNDLIKKFENL